MPDSDNELIKRDADDPSAAMDRLTSNFSQLPGILAQLGMSVATAQKALDENYTANLIQLIQVAKDTLIALERQKPDIESGAPGASAESDKELVASVDNRAAAVTQLLTQIAPSRYQFTETTLDFRADLSETRDKTIKAEIGIGVSAVTLNASYTKSFGYDYRAAARITSVLHAFPLDATMADKMFQRAGDIHDKLLPLPVDQSKTSGLGLELINLFAGLPPKQRKEDSSSNASNSSSTSDTSS